MILKHPLDKLTAKAAVQTIEWVFTFYLTDALRRTKKTTRKVCGTHIISPAGVQPFKRHRIIDNGKNIL